MNPIHHSATPSTLSCSSAACPKPDGTLMRLQSIGCSRFSSNESRTIHPISAILMELAPKDIQKTIQTIDSIRELSIRISIRRDICQFLAEKDLLDELFVVIAASPKNELKISLGTYYYEINQSIISQINRNLKWLLNPADRANKRASICKKFVDQGLFASALQIANAAFPIDEQVPALYEIGLAILRMNPIPLEIIVAGIHSIQDPNKRQRIRNAICQILIQEGYLLNVAIQILTESPSEEERDLTWRGIGPTIVQIAKTESKDRIIAEINSIQDPYKRRIARHFICKILIQEGLLNVAIQMMKMAVSEEEKWLTSLAIDQTIVEMATGPMDSILVGIYSIQDLKERQIIRNSICEHLIRNGCLLNAVIQILEAPLSEEDLRLAWHTVSRNLIEIAAQSADPIILAIDSIQDLCKRQIIRASICQILIENNYLLDAVIQILAEASSEEEREFTWYKIGPAIVQIAEASADPILLAIDSIQDSYKRQIILGSICQILLQNHHLLPTVIQILAKISSEEEQEFIVRTIGQTIVQIANESIDLIFAAIDSIRDPYQRQTIQNVIYQLLIENDCSGP